MATPQRSGTGNSHSHWKATSTFATKASRTFPSWKMVCRSCRIFGSFTLSQEIIKKCPEKIDIGAVYSAPVRVLCVCVNDLIVVSLVTISEFKRRNFILLRRNSCSILIWLTTMIFVLVASRTCSPFECLSILSGAAICNKCWPFMTAALKVLDTALRGRLLSRGRMLIATERGFRFQVSSMGLFWQTWYPLLGLW